MAQSDCEQVIEELVKEFIKTRPEFYQFALEEVGKQYPNLLDSISRILEPKAKIGIEPELVGPPTDISIERAIECADIDLTISIFERMLDDDRARVFSSSSVLRTMIEHQPQFVDYLVKTRPDLIKTMVTDTNYAIPILHVALCHRVKSLVDLIRNEMYVTFVEQVQKLSAKGPCLIITKDSNSLALASRTALGCSAHYEDTDTISAIFAITDPDSLAEDICINGRTIFHCVAWLDNVHLMRLLLSNKPLTAKLIGKRDNYDQTALVLAGYQSLRLFRMVYNAYLPYGDIYSQKDGFNILCCVSLREVNVDAARIVEYLIQDPDRARRLMSPNADTGFTPLHLALFKKSSLMFELLWNNHIPVESLMKETGPEHHNIMHMAAKIPNISSIIITLLLSHEAGPELVGATDTYGKTPLFYAVTNNRADICRLLYNKMTPEQVALIDNTGQTCMHYANAQSDIMTIFKSDSTKAVKLEFITNRTIMVGQ